MYLERETIAQIIANYFLDKLTDADKAILDEWLEIKENKLFFDRITAEGYMAEELTRLEHCKNRVEINREHVWDRIKG